MSSRSLLLGLLSTATLVLAGCTAASDDSVTGDEQNLTQEVSMKVMATKPICAHEGQPDTWCKRSDSGASAKRAGMEAEIAKIIDEAQDPEKARITIGYFSFSNKRVFESLCDKGKAGFKVEGFFDVSYDGADQLPLRLANECQSQVAPAGGEPNVVVHFLGEVKYAPGGGVDVWRLHHNKFLLVEPNEDGKLARVNFSSGNLSSYGLSLHFDHWAMLAVPADSDIVAQHHCLVGALRDSLRPDGGEKDAAADDPWTYRQSLDTCLAKTRVGKGSKWIEEALAEDRIAPLFAPDPQDRIYGALRDQLSRVRPGGRIYGAMQHFLHHGIARELASAVKRGVEVQLIMDDDVVAGGGEVPGVQEFYRSYLAESASGIRVQFLRTNSGERQMMHNKFLVMENIDGDKTRVFSGAGHFTTSGMRNNYENFYLSQDERLTADYRGLFDEMWARSVDEKTAAAN